MKLADPDERPTGTVEVVVPDSNWDAEAKRFSRSLVQPGGLLEGTATWVQLVDPVGCSEVMVKPVHIVVQDSNSDRKAMRVGRTLVESVGCFSFMPLFVCLSTMTRDFKSAFIGILKRLFCSCCPVS